MGEGAGVNGEPLPDHRADASSLKADDRAATGEPGGGDLDTGDLSVGDLNTGEVSIGELARRSGLSRGTLLYYDRIGVLVPSGRSRAGYRRYSNADAARLARICRYRRAGLSLSTIKELLDDAAGDQTEPLAARLAALNNELHRVRNQQRFILELLGDDPRFEQVPFLSRSTFISLFDLAGVSAGQRARWHAAFERMSTEDHQAFLEFLCLRDDVIEQIRHRASETDR